SNPTLESVNRLARERELNLCRDPSWAQRPRRLFLTAISFVSVVLIAAPVVGQTGGGIIGTVADQTSGVLPGVRVTVSGPALMGTRTDVTASDGSYRLPNLPPGNDYVVVFELPGF